MEELRIRHKVFTVIRKIIAVIMFINGIFWFLGHLDNLKFIDCFFGTAFICLGTAYFVSAFGSDVSVLNPGEGFITIRWSNWLRSVTVQDVEIEKILLTRVYVLISRKGGKALKLTVDYFERVQKKEVYEFLIEYAKQRNIKLETNFNSPL